MGNFHPTAFVSGEAILGSDVSVGPFSVIGPNVRVGAGTVIGSHCLIGESSPLATGQLTIGERSLIRSHSVIYMGSEFGDELETGHHVVLREGLQVGKNLRVGTLSDLQGDSQIGDFVRLHSNVHVGKGSHIGDFVWIFPYVVLTNDPTPPSSKSNHNGVTVQDYAVIATMSCIAPGVTIGRGSLVAAMSMVTRDADPDSVVRGSPSRRVGSTTEVILRDGSGRPAYPWTQHFHSGYPVEIVEAWMATHES